MTLDVDANLTLFKMPCDKALKKRGVHDDGGGYRVMSVRAREAMHECLIEPVVAASAAHHEPLAKIIALQSKPATNHRRHR